MNHPNSLPLILGFVSDLFFTLPIEAAARNLGFEMVWIERMEQIVLPELDLPERQLGEHLVDLGAVLLEQVTRLHPALILFDLTNELVPWREWVALLKSDSATRRIPVLCFGPHVNVSTLQAARQAGADAVMARSRFMKDLPNLLRKYALLPDYEALSADCSAELSALARRGLELFNQGEYFEAHELLEAAWNEDQSAGRELYRAILQVGVAYLQIERSNYIGAAKMFLRVRQWIDPLPDVCRGVEIGRLREDARQVHAVLQALGPQRIREFDRRLFRPVRYS